jgi:hypothetical protein
MYGVPLVICYKSGKLALPALSAPVSFITTTFLVLVPLYFLGIITPPSDTVALEQFNARHHNQSPY